VKKSITSSWLGRAYPETERPCFPHPAMQPLRCLQASPQGLRDIAHSGVRIEHPLIKASLSYYQARFRSRFSRLAWKAMPNDGGTVLHPRGAGKER